MKQKLLSIRKADFMKKKPIYFDNIQCGFNDYHYITLYGSEACYKAFLTKALKLNGNDYAYTDFYYGRLEQEEKENLQNFLTQEDLQILNLIDYNSGIYFPLSEEVLPFLLKITTQEILFSTFYFTKVPCTIWGNYKLKFPMFFYDLEAKCIYEQLAQSCRLEIINNG